MIVGIVWSLWLGIIIAPIGLIAFGLRERQVVLRRARLGVEVEPAALELLAGQPAH